MEKGDDVHIPLIEEDLKAQLLPSVEETMEQSIGHVTWVQIFQTILVSSATFFDSQQTFVSLFAHAMPSWHCTATSQSSCLSNKTNLCTLSKSDWAWDSPNNGSHTSIISEWGLECATSFVVGLPTTCFFAGCLLGGLLLPTLGDSYLGRKNLLVLCSLIMSLAASVSAFSPNLWVYSMFRFLSGVGRGPISVCVMVLLTERVGKRFRPRAVLIAFFALSLGPSTLTGIAYLTRDLSWRSLYLFTSVPGLIFTILYCFFLFESPRWLLMQGRTKEAISVLTQLGRSSSQNSQLLKLPNDVVGTTNDPLVSLRILISKRWAVVRLFATIFPAFGIGLAYFGLLLGVENLGYNIYVTTMLDAVLSLSTSLITFLWWIQHCNRKSSLLGFCTVGGVTCMILSVIDKSDEVAVIAVQLVALFCACMACNILLMYIVELFPTCVRNSSSSVARLALIMGSIFVPTLNLLGRVNRIYSYGIFGLVLFLSGFLFLCLPETRGKAMCDTMEEQEFIDSDQNICC